MQDIASGKFGGCALCLLAWCHDNCNRRVQSNYCPSPNGTKRNKADMSSDTPTLSSYASGTFQDTGITIKVGEPGSSMTMTVTLEGGPTMQPSTQPSETPSLRPSGAPSGVLSALPSADPSASPSLDPSIIPLTKPSYQPSDIPSPFPSELPSLMPCPTARW